VPLNSSGASSRPRPQFHCASSLRVARGPAAAGRSHQISAQAAGLQQQGYSAGPYSVLPSAACSAAAGATGHSCSTAAHGQKQKQHAAACRRSSRSRSSAAVQPLGLLVVLHLSSLCLDWPPPRWARTRVPPAGASPAGASPAGASHDVRRTAAWASLRGPHSREGAGQPPRRAHKPCGLPSPPPSVGTVPLPLRMH
jgi:hypothetical protein